MRRSIPNFLTSLFGLFSLMPSVLFSKIDSHAVSQVIVQAQLARDSLFWRLDWDLSAKKRIVGDGKKLFL
jgi:hypothetical protein